MFENLPLKRDWAVAALVHACGVDLDYSSDGTSWKIPGIFPNSDKLEDPSEWGMYQGPLKNRILEAELYTDDWNGKKSNKIAQYKCSVSGCTIKHPTNLRRKNP